MMTGSAWAQAAAGTINDISREPTISLRRMKSPIIRFLGSCGLRRGFGGRSRRRRRSRLDEARVLDGNIELDFLDRQFLTLGHPRGARLDGVRDHEPAHFLVVAEEGKGLHLG